MGLLDRTKLNTRTLASANSTNSLGSLDKAKQTELNRVLTQHFSRYMTQATISDSKELMETIVEILHTGRHKLTEEEKESGMKQPSDIVNELENIAPRLLSDEVFARQVAQDLVGFGVLKEILKSYPDTTDIGYDGRFLTVETNSKKFIYAVNPTRLPKQFLTDPNGKPRKQVKDEEIVQLASRFALKEDKGWSEGHPIFNGFSQNFRISATNSILSPNGTTMSIRISRPTLALREDNFDNFAPMFVYSFLSQMVRARANVMISGETGTGKTELLKLLVKSIPFSQRIIMIEDVAETQLAKLYPDKEVYDWLTKASEKDSDKDVSEEVTISDLVKDALRNNPSWLMVSETRGKEAYEMFQAVLSGHSLITTLHSISNEAVPSRFVGMSSMIGPIDTDMLRSDFLRYMNLGIHITKRTFADGRVLRYLDELSEFTPDKPNGIHVLFKQRVDLQGGRIYRYYTTDSISSQSKDQLRDKANIKDTSFWELTGDREASEEIMKRDGD